MIPSSLFAAISKYVSRLHSAIFLIMRYLWTLLVCLTLLWKQSLATYGFQCSANFGTPSAFDCSQLLGMFGDTVHDGDNRLKHGIPQRVNNIECRRRGAKLWKNCEQCFYIYDFLRPNFIILDGCNVAIMCEHDMQIPKQILFDFGKFAATRCLNQAPGWGYRAWGMLKI